MNSEIPRGAPQRVSAGGSTKIVYVSSLISRVSFSRYFGTGRKVPSIAAQKFHRLLVEGLEVDPRITEVVVVGAPPVSRAVSDQLFHASHETSQNGTRYIGLPFLNLPLFRQLTILAGTCLTVLKESRDGQVVVVCDVLCGAPSIGALAVRRLTKQPTLGIVTDVPLRRPQVGSLARRAFSQATGRIGSAWLGAFDGYLLLTEPMDAVVNRKQRPHVVIEGLVDTDQPAIPAPEPAHSHRVILYTGSTHRVYGLPMLVEAFRSSGLDGWELHICGSGDYDSNLAQIATEDPRIKFFGVVDNDDAVRRQLNADVLVNPRPTDAEFTKYSFPSKNMEYMASGRPLMTTHLPSMPADYLPHVILLETETVAGYRETLRNVAEMDEPTLDRLGASARRFVLEEKNKRTQASKFIDLIENLD